MTNHEEFFRCPGAYVGTVGTGGATVGTVAAVRTEASTNRDHIFRVGLNYHFNPTLVARY